MKDNIFDTRWIIRVFKYLTLKIRRKCVEISKRSWRNILYINDFSKKHDELPKIFY